MSGEELKGPPLRVPTIGNNPLYYNQERDGTLDDHAPKSVSVLFIGAHPDDFELGCGGTIASHVDRGDSVHLLIFTDGGTGVRGIEKKRVPRYPAGIAVQAESGFSSPGWQNAHKAAEMLGVQSIQILDWPDSKFDTVTELDSAHAIEAALEAHKPSIVYTHHPGDLSVDHRRVAEATNAACRPKTGVKEIYYYHVPSSTDWAPAHSGLPFIPALYVDISDYYVLKQKVLSEVYGCEMRECHPRSIDAVIDRDRLNGSRICVDVAEAFMVGRILR